MTNNKQKGKRVELYVVHWLRARGVTEAKRSVQYCGRAGDADIDTGSQFTQWHIEVKGTVDKDVTEGKLKKWVEQVLRDCPKDRKPVILHKANREKLVAIVQSEEDPETWDFFDAHEWITFLSHI